MRLKLPVSRARMVTNVDLGRMIAVGAAGCGRFGRTVMRLNGRQALIAAIALTFVSSAVASARIVVPPLLPLNTGGGTTPIKGDFNSVTVTNEWGHISVVAGTTSSIKEKTSYNLAGPVLSQSIKNGVLTISVACQGAEPITAGVSVDGVVDVVNDCVDDLVVTVPGSISLLAKTQLGDIKTSGINGDQALKAAQGNVTVQDSTSRNLTVAVSHGNISVAGLIASVATAHTDYGYVDVANSAIGTLDALTNEGGVSVRDCSIPTLAATGTRGPVDVTEVISPSSIAAKTTKGSVTIAVPKGSYNVDAHTPNAVLIGGGITLDSTSPYSVKAGTDDGNIAVSGT